MKRFQASDYKRAAERIRGAVLVCYACQSSLAAEPPVSLKNGFLQMLEREEKRERRQCTMRNIAAALAVALLLSCIFLATNVQARQKMLFWLKSITDRSTIYEIEGSSEVQDISHYRLSDIPKGFALTDSQYTATQVIEYYVSEDGTDSILFQCRSGDTNSTVILQSEEHPMTAEAVSVHGLSADFYPADVISNQSNLIWFDEEKGVVFMLDSTLDQTAMIRMAESIY